jgi:hypothetical protein
MQADRKIFEEEAIIRKRKAEYEKAIKEREEKLQKWREAHKKPQLASGNVCLFVCTLCSLDRIEKFLIIVMCQINSNTTQHNTLFNFENAVFTTTQTIAVVMKILTNNYTQ